MLHPTIALLAQLVERVTSIHDWIRHDEVASSTLSEGIAFVFAFASNLISMAPVVTGLHALPFPFTVIVT